MRAVEKLTLSLNGLEVDCVIGERPDERTRLQRLVVDAVLEVSPEAVSSDDLADTADYAALAAGIAARLKEAECMMIERAAYLAALVCLDDRAVISAEVKVTKSGAVEGLGSASATVRLSKEGREA